MRVAALTAGLVAWVGAALASLCCLLPLAVIVLGLGSGAFMATVIDRHGVQQLVQQGAQLVDVLGAKEYGAEHIPDAINIPLKTVNRQTAKRLNSRTPVIATAMITSETLVRGLHRGSKDSGSPSTGIRRGRPIGSLPGCRARPETPMSRESRMSPSVMFRRADWTSVAATCANGWAEIAASPSSLSILITLSWDSSIPMH